MGIGDLAAKLRRGDDLDLGGPAQDEAHEAAPSSHFHLDSDRIWPFGAGRVTLDFALRAVKGTFGEDRGCYAVDA